MRTANLLRALSRRDEVQEFSQARLGAPPGPSAITSPWRKERYAHPVAGLLAELGVRAWRRRC